MSQERRSAGRRRAWGRGPVILRFDSLEKREVMSAAPHSLPDLVGSSLVTTANADWGDTVTATGQVTNQGDGPVDQSFQVALYAGGRATINRTSVYLGEVTIPAGLAAGASVPFTTSVKLPQSPVPGMNPSGIVYISMKVDSKNEVAESNERNDSGVGPGYDQTAFQVTPQQPASLLVASTGLYPVSANWGKTLSVTAQIANQSYGVAPATRAQVVLTPSGLAQGAGFDVTIGSIDVPSIAAWKTVNVTGNLTLPAIPPVLLAGADSFTLSILPDADFVTNPVSPHYAVGGIGIDQASVNITLPTDATTSTADALPDIAMGSVTVSGDPVWGQSFQVTTNVQNLGTADPGPFRVRFLLSGPDGNTNHAIFLGDAMLAGLAVGGNQEISQTVTLPSRLPSGVVIQGNSTGRIIAVADPESSISETFKNNNMATSAPIKLRLLGSDANAFVPNSPDPTQLLTVNMATPYKKLHTAQVAQAAQATKSGQKTPTKKLFRRPPIKTGGSSVVDKLKVVPDKIGDFFKNLV